MIDTVIHGDCLDTLKQMESDSVDCIVTDPPYGLVSRNANGKASGGFMNKSWDKAVPPVEVWKECLRVLKPGAFAFVMCIPRQDCLSRMIINLEDAGFMVNFTPIYWTYATGFPKTTNLSKLADKRAGVEREVVGKSRRHVSGKPEQKTAGLSGSATFFETIGMGQYITAPATPEAKALEGAYAGFQPKPAVEVVLCTQKPPTAKHRRSDVYRMLNGKYDYWYTQHTVVNEKNRVKLAQKWDLPFVEGDIIERRLALNPELQDEVIANRSVILWEKPYKDTDITSTVTHALDTGKAITWLDDGRIPYENDTDKDSATPQGACTSKAQHTGAEPDAGANEDRIGFDRPCQKGRFAPNLLVSDQALNVGKITKSGVTIQPEFISTNAQDFQPNPKAIPGFNQHGDSGDFSRYFDLDAWAEKNLPTLKTFPFAICSKPSPREKSEGLDDLPDKQMYKQDNSGESLEIFGTTDGGRKPRKNNHPTCKSLSLMSYLIMLLSREGDIVLDPYLGSGTTACAAVILDRHYIGCELDADYVDIAERRIAWHKEQKKLSEKQPNLF